MREVRIGLNPRRVGKKRSCSCFLRTDLHQGRGEKDFIVPWHSKIPNLRQRSRKKYSLKEGLMQKKQQKNITNSL